MVWFTILALVTSGLALGLPPDPHTLQQLRINTFEYHIAILSLLIPYGIIWYAAFYAFDKLRDYAKSITGFDDGKAFRSIAAGMGVLAFGLIIPTAVALILQNIAMHHPGFKPTAVITDDFLQLAFGLIAFIIINNGTHILARMNKKSPSLASMRVFVLLFITLAAVFTTIVLNYHMKHTDVYYLNTPFLIFAFVIPELFGWFIALWSAYEFGRYARYVKGVLYRQALVQFSRGIIVTIIGSIAVQFVQNTFAARVSHSLGALLLVEYALLATVAAGLVMIALGAKKLKKIEDA